MNKELRKAIMVRSCLKSKYNKNPSRENRYMYTQQRNKCVVLRKNAIDMDFKKATENGSLTSKAFYDLVGPYLSNKGGLGNNDIALVEMGEILFNLINGKL